MYNSCRNLGVNGPLMAETWVLIASGPRRTTDSKHLKRNRSNNNWLSLERAGCEAHHLSPSVKFGVKFSPVILIDGGADGYLTSEGSCQLPVRAVTNVSGCDGNDGNICRFFALLSNPDVIALLCSALLWQIDMRVKGKTSLPLWRWFDLMIFSEYSEMLEHSICRHKDKKKVDLMSSGRESAYVLNLEW